MKELRIPAVRFNKMIDIDWHKIKITLIKLNEVLNEIDWKLFMIIAESAHSASMCLLKYTSCWYDIKGISNNPNRVFSILFYSRLWFQVGDDVSSVLSVGKTSKGHGISYFYKQNC